MGVLTYRSNQRIEIEDRTLAHVRSVILAKLRRGEPFGFSWERPLEQGSGRGAIWISTDTPLVFEFFDRRDIPLNPRWLAELTASANSVGGLVLVPEPEAPGSGQVT